MSTREDAVRVVLLGTAGGAMTHAPLGTDLPRNGIASAVIVGDAVYIVDAGLGAARQFVLAGLGGGSTRTAFAQLRAVFLTHLHSDHTLDLVNLMLCGVNQGWGADGRVDVYGPGPAIVAPGGSMRRQQLAARSENPAPGTETFVARLFDAFSVDLNDRYARSPQRRPGELVHAQDVLPPSTVMVPNNCMYLSVQPWVVMEDNRTRVTATLVEHGEMYPCFAYRFDTESGSVVFSGDTAPSQNLIELSRGADILVHEAIDPNWGDWQFGPGPHDDSRQAFIDSVIAAHTPTPNVGRIAQAAGVRILVLSHLVPASLPGTDWESGRQGFDGRFIVGSDLASLPLVQ